MRGGRLEVRSETKGFLVFKFFSLLVSIVGFFFLYLILPTPVSAYCWCNDPVGDSCRCGRSGPPAPGEDAVRTVYQGVDLWCHSAEEANSIFAVKGPICGSTPEIAPYCAFRVLNFGSENEIIDRSQATCYGTEFAINRGNVPLNTGGQVIPWSGPVNFNGFSSNEVTQIFTCESIAFCCARSDINCAPVPIPTLDSCTPSDGSVIPPVGICGAVTGGEGESRLWFPHLKSATFISTLLQSLFAPQPSTLLNNVLPSPEDETNEFTNRNIDTSKVWYHQGADDGIPVVNNTTNNSSLRLNEPVPIPPAANAPYNNYACNITPYRTNPGDDLMGPRINATLVYTQEVTYDYVGKPGTPYRAGCIADGEPHTREQYCDCCSRDPATCEVPPPPPQPEECQTSCGCYNTQDEGAEDGRPSCFFSPPPGGDCSLTTPFACCSEPPPGCSGQPQQYCPDLPGFITSTRGTVSVAIKNPLVEYLQEVTTVGEQSIFNRLFPKDPGRSFDEIPAPVTFSATGGDSMVIADGQGTIPTFYIPHLGTIYDNFLKRVQTLLRPQGYGEVGPPSSTGSSTPLPPVSGTCQMGTDWCSPETLSAAFGEGANQASQVCRLESRGIAAIVNNYCLPGSPRYTRDYSVGLFQINMLAHPNINWLNSGDPYATDLRNQIAAIGRPGMTCWQALEELPPGSNPRYCTVVDQELLDVCVAWFQQPQNNIAYARYISGCGSARGCDWCPVWSAGCVCGLP